MNDAEFLQKFTDTTLPKSEFKHQSHIRLAWIYLMKHNFDDASDLIIRGIKNYAASVGASHIYHETLTRAWIQLVADAIAVHPHADSFSQFINTAPELLNKNAPLRLYTQKTLDSERARHEWIQPE